MNYSLCSFLAVSFFAGIHFLSDVVERKGRSLHGRVLSFGSGVAISYVFIDLMPKLSEANNMLQPSLQGIFPYIEHHVYIMALLGFLLFYMVDKCSSIACHINSVRVSLAAYSLFNFFVGYSVSDSNNPEIQPLILFVCAISLHYFSIDYSFLLMHGREYRTSWRRLVIASLFIGWGIGHCTTLSQTAVSLVNAFIGGGVIMNVIRNELPEQRPSSSIAFVSAAAMYTLLLLSIGESQVQAM